MGDPNDRTVGRSCAPLQLQAIVENLPAGFDILRAEALAEGHRFIERLAVDWLSGKTRFDREGEALLAATVGGVLTGVGGLTIEPVVPDALRMRRFYVRPPWRRGGVGRILALELLGRARRSGHMITVNAATESMSFWESLGFRPDARFGHTHLFNECGF
jgi:GNAT superfamily N-acetyltransferase